MSLSESPHCFRNHSGRIAETFPPLMVEVTRMLHERITIDPKVMFGKPVITGTRVTAELILRKTGEGMTDDQILEHHPHLMLEDIRAAAAFAADHLAAEGNVPASGITQ